MIKIKNITVRNFGGIASAEFSFNDVTKIESASGTGKTSIYNAYMFCLGFNVDNYEPKINGKRLFNVNSEVEMTIVKDNFIEYILSKKNTQKYKVDDGIQKFVGNTAKYYIDGQEKTLTDYKQKISEIYGVDYTTLELLTSTTLFNSETPKWNKKTRRKFLFDILNIENEIKGIENDYPLIKEYLDKNYTEIEITDALNKEKAKIEREQTSNNSIIAERERDIEKASGIDFQTLKEEKELLQKQYAELLSSPEYSISKEKTDRLNELLAEISAINTRNTHTQIAHDKEVSNVKNDIRKIENDLIFINHTVSKAQEDITCYEIELQEIKDRVFNDKDKYCSLCGQILPQEKIEYLTNNFELQKIKDIEKQQKILDDSQKILIKYTEDKKTQEEKLASLKEKLNELAIEFPNYESTEDLQKELDSVQNTINELRFKKSDFDNALKVKKQNILNRIAEIDKELSYEKILENAKARIEELIISNRNLLEQESLRLAKKEQLKDYSRRKVLVVENKVAQVFENVKFTFFKYQTANALNMYEDICSVTMDNVEYENMSSGQKVKANYYTTSAIRKIMNLNIPQFVDDVVLSDLDLESKNHQIIYLITNNNKNISCRLIKQIYTENDCFKVE